MDNPKLSNQESSIGVGLYKIKTIAEFSGFSPNLLRAWERRYDLLKPKRKASGHRLYTEADRLVLASVGALMSEGRSIGEIAALGRQHLISLSNHTPVAVPELSEEFGESLELMGFKKSLVAATLKFDSRTLETLLDECFAEMPQELVFDHIMTPVVRQVGDLWSQGEASVAHERLLSELFCRRIYQSWSQARRNDEKDFLILTGCLPDEQHEMGALLVTYHLAALGVDARYLGSLPLLDLEIACLETAPKLVLLSVTRRELFEVHRDRLCEVVTRQRGVHFVLGGSGLQDKHREVVQIGAELWPNERPLSRLGEVLGIGSR